MLQAVGIDAIQCSWYLKLSLSRFWAAETFGPVEA